MDSTSDAGVDVNVADDRQHHQARHKPQPISAQSAAKLENYIGDGSYRMKSRPLQNFRSGGFGKSPTTGRIALKQELQREHARQQQTKELQRLQKGSLDVRQLQRYASGSHRKAMGQEDGVVNASLMTSSSLPSELYTMKSKLDKPIDFHVGKLNKTQHQPANLGLSSTYAGSTGNRIIGDIPEDKDADMSSCFSDGSKLNVDQEVDDMALEDLISLESSINSPSVPLSATLQESCNFFDGSFDNVNAPSLTQNVSYSCPPDVHVKQEPEVASNFIEKVLKDRQKKDNHNLIERRRRFNINDRIKELGALLPKQDADMKTNKGIILKATVDYVKKLQREIVRLRQLEEKQHQLEATNKRLLLRIQELEMHARAHGIPTTPLTSDTTTENITSSASVQSILSTGILPEIMQPTTHTSQAFSSTTASTRDELMDVGDDPIITSVSVSIAGSSRRSSLTSMDDDQSPHQQFNEDIYLS
ncbi:Microphthalmia-associated transcription factor [Trichoplax sp. H2]|nr:Microphthalmia-associated transcription factor [Trichoplax sp. H2]|eukprot:RDD37858.1 Microphthalmia-associated transcription factor [Trichoplax sp. H2]